MMKPLIVMPTYNESPNVEKIIRAVFSEAKQFTPAHILVVDDNSPDGTAGIVIRLKKMVFADTLFLMQRNAKLGLGTAYIDGFRWGLQKGYDIFVEMDADFSHHPRYLNPMLKKMNAHDFIIGSRYVQGGGVKGWGVSRKAISKFGSFYARTILGLPIKDLTGGFNMWKRNVLQEIDLSTVRSQGYAFQIELKNRAFSHAFRFYEYPIIFEDRMLGKSKMSKKIVLEAMVRVWQMRFSRKG